MEMLISQFGELSGAQRSLDCMKNAVHNAALAILAGQDPVIYDVTTPQGRHAYLELDGHTYSRGVTWTTDFYPELTSEEIISQGGVDATDRLLIQALNPENDVYGYHRVLDRLESRFPDIKSRLAAYLENKFREAR